MTMPENWNCPVCGAQQAPAELAKSDTSQLSRYVRCRACQTIVLWPLPPAEENREFEGEDTARSMAEADNSRKDLLQRRVALAGTPSPGRDRFLDVGCSTGRALAIASKAGWQVTGLELSAALAAEARAHVPEAHVIIGDVMQVDLETLGTFDVIMALDVIEHVLNPADFLKRLYHLLTPGGRLILHTPNAASLRARLHGPRWNMLIPQYHFFLFTAAGLTTLLQRSGYRVLTSTTASGTGLERGPAKAAAAIKEAGLRIGHLGNALLITAGKPADG